jgi:hypothetical protein
MGSVVNGHAPAYRVWWLYTYTHLEWGTWGTAAFFRPPRLGGLPLD